MDPIKCNGGFYAVTVNGHLIAAKSLKDGMRWASAADIAAAEDIEAKRAAKEKPIVAGPLKGA